MAKERSGCLRDLARTNDCRRAHVVEQRARVPVKSPARAEMALAKVRGPARAHRGTGVFYAPPSPSPRHICFP